jgi:hypothetical protein
MHNPKRPLLSISNYQDPTPLFPSRRLRAFISTLICSYLIIRKPLPIRIHVSYLLSLQSHGTFIRNLLFPQARRVFLRNPPLFLKSQKACRRLLELSRLIRCCSFAARASSIVFLARAMAAFSAQSVQRLLSSLQSTNSYISAH